MVKYREGKSIYKNCLFKKAINSHVNEYLPEAITAYGITNGSHLESRQLTDKKGNSLTIFAKVLVRGRLNLYQYQDQLFLAKQGEALTLLHVEKEAAATANAASTQHLILINSLTLDCPVPEEKLATVLHKVNTQPMIEIVESYNNCISPNSSITYNAAYIIR